MAEKQIQISRDGIVLGTMTESEAAELLQLGLLKSTDQFSVDGVSGWQSLNELRAPSPPGKANWFAQATRSLSAAGSAVASTTGVWVDRAKTLAGATQSGATSVADKLLSGFIPQIRKIVSDLVQTKPFQSVRSGVNDDQLMLKVFGAAHDCLPKPVCRFISEQQFVALCMKHRAQLLRRESSEPDKSI